jgi:hypothetical protein
MKSYSVTAPELALVALTRGMLGAGIGYVTASRLSDAQRRAVGRTLMLVGAMTTIPLVMELFKQKAPVT